MSETTRILVVDDDATDVAIIRRALSAYDRTAFDVDWTAGTSECEERLKQGEVALVLLDYSLPKEDGLTFLRRLNGRKDLPPIIMLTGRADQRTVTEALRCGAYDYLSKDAIDSTMLGEAIHQALEKFRLEQQVRTSDERFVFALACAAEVKHPGAEGHVRRMGRYAVAVGKALDLDAHQLEVLRFGAILHDVGKIAVRESVLGKAGLLTDEDWSEVKQHPAVGERICSFLTFADDVCPIVRCHHERWDGRGYPDRISKEEIPYLARIVSVVDAFDAMSANRPYRTALPLEETIRRLSKGAGRQWDPQVVNVLLDCIDRGGFGLSGPMSAIEEAA